MDAIDFFLIRYNELHARLTDDLLSGLSDAQARGRRYTFRAPSCYSGPVARNRNTRLNVTLDDQYAEKLSRLAERTHTQEGTLARSLLSHALDEADPDPRHVADLLDGIPGAYERALLGRDQARAGTTTPLDDL